MTDHELQSQRLAAQRDRLFCDLKTDEEKSAFFLSGRGYETGVIAHSIQNDVAMAYHRCSEYRKEMEALQAECDKLLEEVLRLRVAMAKAAQRADDWLDSNDDPADVLSDCASILFDALDYRHTSA